MDDRRGHLSTVREVSPSSTGREDCLRMCMHCGHVGCCDNSPNRHATGHWRAHADHPVIRSFEPGEDWWWCCADDLFFEIPRAAPASSHP